MWLMLVVSFALGIGKWVLFAAYLQPFPALEYLCHIQWKKTHEQIYLLFIDACQVCSLLNSVKIEVYPMNLHALHILDCVRSFQRTAL